MIELTPAVATYIADTKSLAKLDSSTETTFYPAIRTVLTEILRSQRLPFEVRTGTAETKPGGINMPDFVLGDNTGFVGVFGEVKPPGVGLAELANSTEQNDQIGRYLAKTGVVIVSNVRGFGLVACVPGFQRDPATPVPPQKRDLLKTVDLWSASTGAGAKMTVDEDVIALFVEIVTRSVTDFAPIASPEDLAKVLARQARDAKDALPDDLKPVQGLLDDYKTALGLAFTVTDEKGDRFFRSSLVQTAFYSLFAAWILWDQDATPDVEFKLEDANKHLPIPFLAALLHDLRHPERLEPLGLDKYLDRAIATLNRIDRPLFRTRMSFPSLSEQTATAAITYFYEPFLEAFDPQLREELGVWYTPPEIVRYQVRRVNELLKQQLGRARGLADNAVYVLDPCCGTGAYLLEVARCIADELKVSGDEATVGLQLAKAFHKRVIGFEILTAPFAIAQLQLHILLKSLGAEPKKNDRLFIFLTNALAGWNTQTDVKLTFPEMRDEYDASQQVKHKAPIIVVLGNPPYDRFAGVAQSEEAELVAHYKGIELVVAKDKDGTVLRDAFSAPIMKQKGLSLLFKEFGVRKQLLDDLYIRFIRLAEQRIGDSAEYGIVSFITNSSYLTGRSHPLMRHSLLSNFHEVWIDNLNGDKYRTGKLIPKGIPGAGSADQSVFTTDMDARGIQPGTAIGTWVKRKTPKTAPTVTKVHYRDFWGLAAKKRAELVASITPGSTAAAPAYADIVPTLANRWRLSPASFEGGYESWPSLDELFPERLQGVNHNRGIEGGIIDGDRVALEQRLKAYFGAKSFAQAASVAPDVAKARSRYEPEKVWKALRTEGHYDKGAILPFLTFPLDQRHIYYVDEHKWLNEARSEYFTNLPDNEFLVTVPEPRKVSEARPVFATTLVNLHVQERGAVAIPRESQGQGLLTTRVANIADGPWRSLKSHFGLEGARADAPARHFVGDLLRVALATLHAPAYQREHASALSADWAHLPIPKAESLLKALIEKGRVVARLLDANVSASESVNAVLGAKRAAALGSMRRDDGGQVTQEDLKVTITYWGGGKGRWAPRPYVTQDYPLDQLGERTGDLYINAHVFFGNLPEAVWTYQLGGYPVLKKWLGYRQANRRNGMPLSDDEWRWFRVMIQRISALIAMGPELDALYQEVVSDAFTATELAIVR